MRPAFLLFALLVAFPAQATVQGTVIFISRKLRLSSDEPISAKDFYLNRGDRHGLRTGDSVEIYREMSVLNGLTGNSVTLVRVKLGEMKVLATGDFSAVARMETMSDPRDLPSLDYPGVMLGDSFVSKGESATPAESAQMAAPNLMTPAEPQ